MHLLALIALGTVWPAASVSAGPLQIYGAWHCSNDACTWGAERTVTEFDSKNHWLVDRGDGRPSVNLVVLSFVHPLKLLNQTTDATTLNGVTYGNNSNGTIGGSRCNAVAISKNAAVPVVLAHRGTGFGASANDGGLYAKRLTTRLPRNGSGAGRQTGGPRSS